MAASIRSLRNGITPIIGASRDDLVAGDVVTVNANAAATTYAWTLAFAPDGSAAVFSGDVTQISPGDFTVDLEGPYLIRLTVDAGLITESTQYVRLRALTVFGDLKLVAAGERRDATGIIPVDVDVEGWANEQNFNLQTLKGFIKSVAASGRLLYVDANAGVEGYADYETVQDANDAAVAAGASLATPYIVAVRPGLYVENITFAPHVHVIGWPGNASAERDFDVVVLRGLHVIAHAAVGDLTVLADLTLENTGFSVNALLRKIGAGKAALYRCQLEQRAVFLTQGAACDLQGGSLYADGVRFRQLATADDRVAFVQSVTNTSAYIQRCQFNGPSAADFNSTLAAGVTATVRDSEFFSTGGATSWAVRCSPQNLQMDYCHMWATTGDPLLIHPTGGVNPGAVSVTLRWSFVEGDVNFDVTGIVGATTLNIGSCEYTDLVFPGGAVTTLAATTMGTSLFYDNTTTGMTAENVQAALDEVWALAVLVTTLDDAYDGGVPGSGSGRTIIADAGAVQILDANPPSSSPPPGNTDGVLQVVSSVEIGAVGVPEINLDPNPFGEGPTIVMGQAVVPTDIPFGAGTAIIMGNSTGSPLYRNYNLRVQTKSSDGGTNIGRLIFRGGDAYDRNPSTPDAASVYIEGGDCSDPLMGNPGDIFLSPGFGQFGPTPGSLWIVDPALSTPATLTAGGVFVGGVAGDITFATHMGGVTASIAALDNLAAVLVKLNALEGVTAAGNPIVITTTATGPNAVIYELASDAGVSVALGDFTAAGGAVFVPGTYAAMMDIQCPAAGVLSIGPSGATGPLVYNSATGKLTVPGIIDPTGIVFDEAATVATGAAEGAIFVSDGSGGLVVNHLYYRAASNGAYSDLTAGATNNTLDQAYDQGGAGVGRTITADSGAVTINNAVADATNTLELTRTVGTGGALAVGPAAAVIFGDGDTVLGGNAMAGTEKFRVVGDARIEGKLTVTGLLDPTGVIVEQAAAPATTASQAALFVSDGTGGFIAGEVYLRKASSVAPLRITSGNDAAGYLMPYHVNMPEVPNDSVSYKGWCPVGCTLVAIRVCMEVLDTSLGTYLLTVTNEGTGNSCLVAATFDMHTLVAASVTSLVLTATAADLAFAAADRWIITLTSDDAGFDGEAIYIEMVFKVT